MQIVRLALLAVATAFLCACSSTLHVTEVTSDSSAQKAVDGVPFRVRERVKVEIYQKTAKGYKLVGEQIETLANPSKVYILHYEGKAFANATTKFEQRSDGTFSSVTLDSEVKVDEALTSIGNSLEAVATQATAIKTAEQARETAEVAAFEKQLTAADTNEVGYITAKTAADVAQAELDALSSDVAISVRLAKEGDVRRLKALANQAARKADLPRPFPEY